MELLVPLAIGLTVGFLLGWAARSTRRTDEPDSARGFRPNKRQRQILATLPPDPELPTIEDLVREEAAELGVDKIGGADLVPLHVRLRVWKRDRPELEDCPDDQLRYEIAGHVRAVDATAEDVRLTCTDPSEAWNESEPGSV